MIPGHRAGPNTAQTTHADLLRIFGTDNVTDEGPEDVGEGDFERVTIVNKSRPETSALILWTDGDASKSIAAIRFCYLATAPCLWHTAEGITLGMPLKTLEKLNGRPFTLAGFDWDYSGTITSSDGGQLSGLRRGCGSLILRLAPTRPKASKRELWSKLEDQVQGDREFSPRILQCRR